MSRLIGIFIAVILGGIVLMCDQWETNKNIKQEQDSYITLCDSLGEQIVSIALKYLYDSIVYSKTEKFDLKGKIIVLRVSGGHQNINLDSYYEKLIPNYLTSNSINDIQTLLLIKSGTTPVGSYSNGGIASKQKISVAFVDLKSKEIKASSTFFGDEPPSSITTRSGNHHGAIGGAPNQVNVDEYIKSILIEIE